MPEVGALAGFQPFVTLDIQCFYAISRYLQTRPLNYGRAHSALVINGETADIQPMDSTPYQTQYGDSVPDCSLDEWRAVLERLLNTDGLSALQLAEGVSYSLAMVVRYALGLSAADGQVTVLESDGFFGWCALATARHLADAGCSVTVGVLDSKKARSNEQNALEKPLRSRSCRILDVDSAKALQELYAAISSSHNVICGILDPITHACPEVYTEMSVFLNESPVPVHTVGVPTGIDLHTGEITKPPLYSSSTLSLGLPFKLGASAYDLLGRHYLADLQWDLPTYRRLSYTAAPLFREQPVIKLLQVPRDE